MSKPFWNRAIYIAAIVFSYALSQFAIELGKGTVPIPPEWQWVVPILNAAITGALMFRPRVGYEDIAQQTDLMTAQGHKKRDLVVVTQHEAVVGIANAPPPDVGRMPPPGKDDEE